MGKLGSGWTRPLSGYSETKPEILSAPASGIRCFALVVLDER